MIMVSPEITVGKVLKRGRNGSIHSQSATGEQLIFLEVILLFWVHCPGMGVMEGRFKNTLFLIKVFFLCVYVCIHIHI